MRAKFPALLILQSDYPTNTWRVEITDSTIILLLLLLLLLTVLRTITQRHDIKECISVNDQNIIVHKAVSYSHRKYLAFQHGAAPSGPWNDHRPPCVLQQNGAHVHDTPFLHTVASLTTGP
jgi:hypothetical protein